jgi:hypothetical protein
VYDGDCKLCRAVASRKSKADLPQVAEEPASLVAVPKSGSRKFESMSTVEPIDPKQDASDRRSCFVPRYPYSDRVIGQPRFSDFGRL